MGFDLPFQRPDIIRPPSESESYFLPLTRGCSNNTCAFCNYYGEKLGIRNLADVKKEIDAIAIYMSSGIRLPNVSDIVYLVARKWDGRRIFLQDGDALVFPFTGLKEALQYLNNKFSCLERVGTYATPRDILRRKPDELKQLREQKLGIIYMGMESGDDETLLDIGKGADARQIVEAGRKVKEAGITLSVTVILGLGGIEKSEQHAHATARILSEMNPDYAAALTLTIVPGTPLYERAQSGDFHPISPFRSLEELRVIIEDSDFTSCFFSSMHASNYLSVRGQLPLEKAKMIKQLDVVLSKKDPSLLRPESMRGL